MSRYFDKDGLPLELFDWAKLFEDFSYRRIAFDEVEPYEVSTVWMGIDHNFVGYGPPIIFETMVFEKDLSESEVQGHKFEYHQSLDGLTRRYSTLDEALDGHREVVDTLKAAKAGG